MAPAPSGETTNIHAATTFMTSLAEHLRVDVLARIDQARSTLAGRNLDPGTLNLLTRLRTQGDIMAALCAEGAEHLSNYHRAMENAVTSTPEVADTDFYRPGPAIQEHDAMTPDAGDKNSVTGNASAAGADVGDIGPGAWYRTADGGFDEPYLDWSSSRVLDDGRHALNVELGDGTDAVAVDLDDEQLQELCDELGRTLNDDADAESALSYDDGTYIDFSLRNDDGTRHFEIGDGEQAVAVDLTDAQLAAIHAQLSTDMAQALRRGASQ